VTESLPPQKWRPSELAGIAFVVAIFLVGGGVLVTDYVSEKHARQELLAVISKASEVRMNGQGLEDPSVLLLTLPLVGHVWDHHSHPTTPIQLELINQSETTYVVIARDSLRQTEFWVFRRGPNRHRDPLGQPAGRITSTDLDKFLRKRGL
jgi:hypothetical protein